MSEKTKVILVLNGERRTIEIPAEEELEESPERKAQKLFEFLRSGRRLKSISVSGHEVICETGDDESLVLKIERDLKRIQKKGFSV